MIKTLLLYSAYSSTLSCKPHKFRLNVELEVFGSVATLVGGLNLGEWSLKLRQANVSCKSQLYSEYQTVYNLRVF